MSLLKAILDWWPIWLIAAVFLAIPFVGNILERAIKKWRTNRRFESGMAWRSDQEMLYHLRGMNPTEFEQYTASLFNKLGYKAWAVGQSHDGGIDVIAEKDGIKHYVQCKKYYAAHEVGVGAIRDFYGAIAGHLANGKGFFVTTSKFTLEAEKFAEDKPIELIDSQRLIKYIHLAEEKK